MRLKILTNFFTPVNILLTYLAISCLINVTSFANYIIFDSDRNNMYSTFWIMGTSFIVLSLIAFTLILRKRNLGFMFAFLCLLLQVFFVAPANTSWALSTGTPILIGISVSNGGFFFDVIAVYDYFYMSNIDLSHLYRWDEDLRSVTWVSLNLLPLAIFAAAYRDWKQSNNGAAE